MSVAPDASPDRALRAALAEFTAIRSLMSMRFQMQIAVLSAGLTAIGVIAGLALQHSGDRRLLLLVPILASVVATIHTELGIRIDLHGRYVNEKLWPYVTRVTDNGLPSWEVFWGDEAPRVLMAVAGTQASGLFVAASIATLVMTAGSLGSDVSYTAIWTVGTVMTVLAVAYAAYDTVLLLRRIDRPTVNRQTKAAGRRGLRHHLRRPMAPAATRTAGPDRAAADAQHDA